MSGSILEYLDEYGKYSLRERPFCDVDSLILCQLSYLKFDGIVPDVRENKPSVGLQDIAAHTGYERLFADERYEKPNRALLERICGSVRFGAMRFNFYINVVEKEWETQFSAVTFFLADGTVYVAFRGTDETIVGWKEDFNMAFLSPVPGQSYSVEYLNRVSGMLHEPFYVGGHSKGGNLAVYGAMNCGPKVQKRILKIYSMDGPGFRREMLEKCGYDNIKDKVVKILPRCSLVGMLFERDIGYQVIESKGLGLYQHDPYTWIVKNGKFVNVKDIYEGRKFLDDAINEWILSLDEKQMHTFVDTLYRIISASEAEDLIAFSADRKKSMTGMINALKELDEDTSRALMEIVNSLFEITGSRVIEETAGKTLNKLKKKEMQKGRA